MNKTLLLLALAILVIPSASADEPAESAKATAEAAAAEYARVAQDAELARAEAERARAEATRVAERAREAVRMRDRIAREQAEQSKAQTEEMQRERARNEAEIERAREELSRAHRELREAQREVARAHRELDQDRAFGYTTRIVNLGDKPVIGVILGGQTGQGVELVGVSPDGPAEAAGVKAGDVLVAIDGKALDGVENARAVVFEAMESVEAGDTVEIEVERDGSRESFAVLAEVREPASWQSLVRIPEIRTVKRIEGGPGEHRIVIDSTVAPEIDEDVLSERMEILREKLAETELYISSNEFHHLPGSDEIEWHSDYTFEFDDYSELGDHALSSANVWFGLPRTHGLKLASVNEGLGAYFKTDHGVLVLEAREDNSYQLEAGDVILEVGDAVINTPADLVRALRNAEPGDELEIGIKRDRRNRTLTVIIPENRFGLRW